MQKLDISTRQVKNILRLTLLKKAFKAKIRLQLTESQRKSRIEASQVLLDKQNILAHTSFTDDSWFYSDGIAQKKNQYYWALSYDVVKPLVPNTLIKFVYHGSLKIEELKFRRKLARSYFMQDGATPHTAITTRTMIKQIFGNRVVGKQFLISWPPYSPDLTPADCWLLPTFNLKRMIFNKRNQPISSIGSLKKPITFSVNQLRRINLEPLKPAVVKRLKLCITKKGFRF